MTKELWPTSLTSCPAQKMVMDPKWPKMIPSSKLFQNDWNTIEANFLTPNMGVGPILDQGPFETWSWAQCNEHMTI